MRWNLVVAVLGLAGLQAQAQGGSAAQSKQTRAKPAASAPASSPEQDGQKYLDKAAKEKGAVKLPSGVIYQDSRRARAQAPRPSTR